MIYIYSTLFIFKYYDQRRFAKCLAFRAMLYLSKPLRDIHFFQASKITVIIDI